MSFQKIMAGETDTNSPLNQALMDKIRENFDYLAANPVLAYLDTERTRSLSGGSWHTVKQGLIFVPSYVNNLVFKVECYYYSSDTPDRQLRVKVENGSGGYNTSEIDSVSAGSYSYQTLTVPGSGAFTGAGAWRGMAVESKHGDIVDRDFYIRTVVCKVNDI